MNAGPPFGASASVAVSFAASVVLALAGTALAQGAPGTPAPGGDVSKERSAGEAAAPPAEPETAAQVAPLTEAELSAGASALLTLAEDAMTNLDYPRSRMLADRAIVLGGLGLHELTRAYRLIAVCSAQLDDTAAAEAAFLRLFALAPDANIALRLAPARRSAVLTASGFWSVHKEDFGLDVSYARPEHQIVVRVRDPIDWAKSVHVWWRFGDRKYEKAHQPVGRELSFEVADIGPTDALEVYAFAVDGHGNVIMQFGGEHEPHAFTLSDEELAALLRRDIRGGQTGSFALRLEELGVNDLLIVRGGFFEVPVGAFNEYLYPDFLRITALPPLFSLSLVPALWSEVGVQLRGRLAFGADLALTYAAFIANGLEQKDAAPHDGVVQDGGDIREMRFNSVDLYSGDKALGGRVGLEVGEFDVGVPAGASDAQPAAQERRRLRVSTGRRSPFRLVVAAHDRLLDTRANGACAAGVDRSSCGRARGAFMLTLGLLASHRGSNVQAVVEACRTGRLRARPGIVISNNANSGVLQFAEASGIPALRIGGDAYANDEKRDEAILAALQSHGVELVLLLGYMKLLGPRTTATYRGRILNTHPALLPRHGGKGMYGMRVHEAVIAAGDKETGVTIHLVDEEYDHGAIVAQTKLAVLPSDDPTTLAARVLEREHAFLVETLQAIAAGSIRLPGLG